MICSIPNLFKRQIRFYFLTECLFRRNIFVSKSHRSGYMWDIQRKLPHEKDILSFVLSTWRFHASPASIFTVHRSRTPRVATLPRGPEPLRPQWSSGATPAPSPFRIKSEKSRGASRRHCVTCRCGSVCGRQRRHDANSGRLCLCHWIIHLHVYRGMRGDKCEGEKSACMKITGANGEKQRVRVNADDRIGEFRLTRKNRNRLDCTMFMIYIDFVFCGQIFSSQIELVRN